MPNLAPAVSRRKSGALPPQPAFIQVLLPAALAAAAAAIISSRAAPPPPPPPLPPTVLPPGAEQRFESLAGEDGNLLDGFSFSLDPPNVPDDSDLGRLLNARPVPGKGRSDAGPRDHAR
jgi:hypothetical protein